MPTKLIRAWQTHNENDWVRRDSSASALSPSPHSREGVINSKRDLDRIEEDLEYPSRQFPRGHETVFRMLVHSSRVGAVIGKGGDHIKQMREDTGARVKVAIAIPNCIEKVVIFSSVVGGWMDE